MNFIWSKTLLCQNEICSNKKYEIIFKIYVAKNATLVTFEELLESNSSSNVIKQLDHVLSKINKKAKGPMVSNLTLSFSYKFYIWNKKF
jgi:hypothetical protein